MWVDSWKSFWWCRKAVFRRRGTCPTELNCLALWHYPDTQWAFDTSKCHSQAIQVMLQTTITIFLDRKWVQDQDLIKTTLRAPLNGNLSSALSNSNYLHIHAAVARQQKQLLGYRGSHTPREVEQIPTQGDKTLTKLSVSLTKKNYGME